MIACLDVHYHGAEAKAACLLLENWHDKEAAGTTVISARAQSPYEPGKFYKRELGPLLEVLSKARGQTGRGVEPTHLVIDGYVWLSKEGEPGLGAYLYRSLQQKIPVIGVAKNPFKTASFAVSVLRGKSKRPLYITAAGMEKHHAARRIQTMLEDTGFRICSKRLTGWHAGPKKVPRGKDRRL